MNPVLSTAIEDEELRDLLTRAADRNEFEPLESRLETAREAESLLAPNEEGDKTQKYRRAFARVVIPKIMDALRDALPANRCPEIVVSLDEVRNLMRQNNLGDLGSPQDFLYAFTSERYDSWVDTLTTMGFRSACMSGQGQLTVTMAPRLMPILDSILPITVNELEGAISNDFKEAYRVISQNQIFSEEIKYFLNEEEFESLKLCADSSEEKVNDVLEKLEQKITENIFQGSKQFHLHSLFHEVKKLSVLPPEKMSKAFGNKLRKTKSFSLKQEQIALKYIEEGKFLQKLFGGEKTEDIQSNVKMVKNPFRGNKIEVDRIYRLSGKKHIVLVEAKADAKISRGQLYQLYETFSLRLPPDWQVSVVAVLLTTPSSYEAESPEGKSKLVLDLALIGFDEEYFGKLTESLILMRTDQHIRWLIH